MGNWKGISAELFVPLQELTVPLQMQTSALGKNSPTKNH